MAIIILSGIFLVLLSFDLLVLHKKGTEITNKKAAIETGFWVSIALSFSIAVYYLYQNGLIANTENIAPYDAVIKYITGYLIELSLSVDNLFVISMVFAAFKIPKAYQYRALFWGIIGAVVLRGLMISIGIVLIEQISWMTYVLGLFLLFTAYKMIAEETGGEEKKYDYDFSRFFKVSKTLDQDKFWTTKNGVKMATPLFAALVVIEFTDVLFALDSIPAILAVTTDTFLVFSSNIFAILGLRSMYFFLANMIEEFHFLKHSVFAILIFVAIKLLSIHFLQIPEWFSLAFVGVSLAMGILVSIKHKEHEIRQAKVKKD